MAQANTRITIKGVYQSLLRAWHDEYGQPLSPNLKEFDLKDDVIHIKMTDGDYILQLTKTHTTK